MRKALADRSRTRVRRSSSLASASQKIQPLPDLEEGHALLGDADAVARLGVAAFSGIAVPDAKAPEPPQFNLVPFGERIGDVVEDGVDDQLRLLLRQARQFGDFFDEIRFGHEPAPSTGTLPRWRP